MAGNAVLTEYQQVGRRFLASSSGALLADEMGLGKTAQAAAALADVHESGVSSLVVAPAFLISNWLRELARWAPSLSTRRLQGDPIDRHYTYQLPVGVHVASYGQISRDAWDLFQAGARFNVVVLDEAQRVKNTDTVSHQAVAVLRRRRSWALTGTPVENRVADLSSIFQFVIPGFDPRGSGIESLLPLILRRTRSDVFGEGSNVAVENSILVTMEGPQRRRYVREVQAIGSRTASAAETLGLITRLKVICNFDDHSGWSCKSDALEVILEDARYAERRVVVFSQFRQTVEYLARRFGSFQPAVIDGTVKPDRRQRIVDRFETGECRLLFVSLHAGGVGLNLGSASDVVMFDRWWNPAVEDQAVARAVRFDRTEPLIVTWLTVDDSIEMRIVDLVEEKRALAADLLDRVPSDQTLDISELNQLLRLERRNIREEAS